MEAKKDNNIGNEKIATISELSKLVEALPEGKLLQIEFVESEDGENEDKS